MVQKVAERSLVQVWALLSDYWKTFSVNPAVNGYIFRIRENKAAKGAGWAPPFFCCAHDPVGL